MTAAHRRAFEELGVPARAAPADVKAALLRKLEGDGFVPPEEWLPAVNAAAGTALPVTRYAAGLAAAAVREEVEAFGAAFWSLPPADRRARWADLSARCPEGPTKARLRGWEPGLDVPVTPHADPQAQELAELVRELFLLPPRASAVRRAAWLAENVGRFKELIPAARRVLKHDMATARLEPPLFDWFALGTPPTEVPPVGHRDPAEEEEAVGRAVAEFQQQAGPHPRPEKSTRGYGWAGVVVILVLSAVIRAGMHTSRDTQPPPVQRPYIPPAVPAYPPPPDTGRPVVVFTTDQLKAFKEYDPKSGQPPPPGYDLYRLTQGRTIVLPPAGQTVAPPAPPPAGKP